MAAFSLLDRFPATPGGHLAFLENVRDEVHSAAEAKRQQLAQGYSNDTLASMVGGIHWEEAARRLAALIEVPATTREAVAGVLRRELTVGTVQRIDALLTPAVNDLRDAWENRGQESASATDGRIEPMKLKPFEVAAIIELRRRQLARQLDPQFGREFPEPAALAAAAARRAGERGILLTMDGFMGLKPLEQVRTLEAILEPPTGGTDVSGEAPPSVRQKRSTSRGDAREKLIAALTQHHGYADGGCLNLEPIGNNALARLAAVSESTASEFFSKQFDGHTKYRAICADPTSLVTALKLLYQEFAPRHLFGAKPPGEDELEETA